jgi:hypothetical protein
MKKTMRKREAEHEEPAAPKRKMIKCNICSHEFHPTHMYDRFCSSCRNNSELVHVVEWMPEHAIYI